MLKISWMKKLVMGVLTLSLLSACTAPTPQISTPNTAATSGAIRTQAASTVIADLTKNAPTATQTSTVTDTATVTSTVTATLPPTATPILATVTPTVTATHAWPTWTPGPTSTPVLTNTPSSFTCAVTKQAPDTWAQMSPSTDYDATWTIKNTSSSAWVRGNTDIVYISGTKMQKRGDRFDLKGDVAAGTSVDVAIDMLAPKDAGSYSATWALSNGSSTLCVFNVSIVVTK